MEQKKPEKPGGFGYVKGGGTSSSAQDQRAAMERADEERRRQHHDAVVRVANTEPGAKLYTRKLGGISENASIVLRVEFADRSLRGYLACDLTVEEHDGKMEFLLLVVCPSCFYGYGGRQRLSQSKSTITLRSYHRKFTLDQTPPEQGGVAGLLWVSPLVAQGEEPEAYTLAGSIHTHETQTCPTCAYRFEIGPARLGANEPPVSGAVRPA